MKESEFAETRVLPFVDWKLYEKGAGIATRVPGVGPNSVLRYLTLLVDMGMVEIKYTAAR